MTIMGPGQIKEVGARCRREAVCNGVLAPTMSDFLLALQNSAKDNR
jgi:hypothetical protein